MTTAPPASLRSNADFRRVIVGGTVAKMGTQVSQLAIPLVAVAALAASPGEVGALAALGTAAWLLIGLPAGAWVDRMRRRPVMIAADVVRATLLASVPVAWAFGVLSMAQLFAVVFLAGMATVFFDVANQSLLPAVVGRESLATANATLVGIDGVIAVGGRGVTGLLVQVVGAPAAVAVDAVGYLWSAWFLGRVRTREAAPRPAARTRLLGEIGAGLRFVGRDPILRTLATAGTLGNLSASVVITMLPLLFVRELGLPAGALGAFLAAGGAGALLGAVAARPLARFLGAGRAIWLSSLVTTPAALVLPLADRGPLLWLAGGAWLLSMVKGGVDNVLGVTFRQSITPPHLLGRMNATFRFMFTGALAVGAALAGVLGETAGVRAALWAGAAGMALRWSPLLFSPLRRMRELPASGTMSP